MYRDGEGTPLLIVGNAGEGNRYATLQALDTATGEVRWTAQLSPGGVPRMCIEGEEIFVLCVGELSCIDYRSGATKWQSPVSSGGQRETQVLGLLDGTLYVASGHYVSAYDPASGKLRWKVEGDNLQFRSLGVPGAVVQGDFARKRADRHRNR